MMKDFEMQEDLYSTNPDIMGLYENRPNLLETMYDASPHTIKANFDYASLKYQ